MTDEDAPSPESAREWSARRRGEADSAGLTAARARQGIVQGLATNNPAMVRAASSAYGVLIDKALLISEQLADLDEPANEEVDPLDDLTARRTARRAGAAS